MSTPVLNNLGHVIRRYRLTQGLSQEQLAERTGLHRTYIGGVERGERNVSLLTLRRIAQAFGVTLADLVQGIDAGE